MPVKWALGAPAPSVLATREAVHLLTFKLTSGSGAGTVVEIIEWKGVFVVLIWGQTDCL